MASNHGSERQALLSQGHILGYDNNGTETASTPTENDTSQRQAQAGDDEHNINDEGPSTLQLLRIMSGVYLAALLSSLDGTLIATLVTPISDSFNSGTNFAWLASAYFIANAASQPLAGKLSDIYGRKTGMVFSNALFGIGNLMCGLARSVPSIIAGRVVAGLGGGGIGPIATSLASDLIPLRSRGLWQGFANICYGIGSSLGGPVGGLIHDAIGWRWAFLLQVPLTAITIVLVIYFQHSPSTKINPDGLGTTAKWKRVDFAGAICLVASLVLLLVGLNAAGNIMPWSHPLVLSTIPTSVVLLALFVVIELQFAREPIIPMHLLTFTHRTILVSSLANWFISAARFAFFFYVPIYFYLQGLSATKIGIRLIPESIAIGTTSVVYGIIMRSTGLYYRMGVLSGVAICLGTGLSIILTVTTSGWVPLLCFVLVGIGFSGMLSVTIIAMIASAEHQYQAIITSISYAFRSTGTTLGITVASAIFQNQLNAQLNNRLKHLPNSGNAIRRLRDNLNEIWNLPVMWQGAAIDSYMDALHTVFLCLLGISLMGLISLLLLGQHKLHNKVSRDD